MKIKKKHELSFLSENNFQVTSLVDINVIFTVEIEFLRYVKWHSFALP